MTETTIRPEFWTPAKMEKALLVCRVAVRRRREDPCLTLGNALYAAIKHAEAMCATDAEIEDACLAGIQDHADALVSL